jgi:hypothetical protein
MAPPKLSSNFKYKALFGYEFLTFALKPSTFESPPLETLNDLHSSFNHNVVSFNNTIIVKIIVNWNKTLNCQKSTIGKQKHKLGRKFQDVWASRSLWTKFVINWDGLMNYM